MKIWLIADTHLGHRSLIRSCGRPENFSQLIGKNWEEAVDGKDLVLHLGDIAWGYNDDNLQKLLRLPGKKILIRGNHDEKTLESYMELGFTFACDEIMMTIEGVKILFTHIPRIGHSADINIHGHQHDLHRASDKGLYLPLALEVQGYAPLELTPERMSLIRSWSDKYKKDGSRPGLDALRRFGPDPIPKLRKQDRVGRKQTTTVK